MRISETVDPIEVDAVSPGGDLMKGLEILKPNNGQYKVLFFYPLDFTFVCPTELVALSKATLKLHGLNTQVFAVSQDSIYTHLAWRNTPQKQGGLGPVHFTMVGDINHDLISTFNVAHRKTGLATRTTVILDQKNVVRHISSNDDAVGRNIDEIIRTIEALQYVDENGEVCPANWTQGQDAIQATAESVGQYLTTREE